VRRVVVPLAVLLLLTLGCSAADLIQRERATATPLPTAVVLVPTFTPTAVAVQTLVAVTPPSEGQPGVIVVPPGMDPNDVLPQLPTATPEPSPTPIPPGMLLTPGTGSATPGQPVSPLETPSLILVPSGTPAPVLPTASPTPAPTSTPTLTPLPTATPTPYIVLESGLVALRTGPGIEFPLLAQLGPQIPVAIIGRSEDGAWLQVCCISGATAWVAAAHVSVQNDMAAVQVAMAGPPPTATPTGIPTLTLTPIPTATATPHPFERAIGPQFFPTSNAFVTIFAKLYIGVSPLEQPAEGYFLTVKFEGVVRPNTSGNEASKAVFEFSAPPGSGNRVLYNYKYEYRPPDPKTLDPNSQATPLQLIGTGTWSVYVSDGLGTQLSQEVTFTTEPSNPNREVYIGWVRIR
jgi:hypothetical protein